jgi:ribosome-binding protein aMBF1 (putative translation factor)
MSRPVRTENEKGSPPMRFKELDEIARKDETPEERTYHDQRRAELRAALYAGIAIRDAREETGLSQTELAARIGIAQSALSRIEAGRANLTLGTLQRVTDALGVSLRLGVGSHEVVIPAA